MIKRKIEKHALQLSKEVASVTAGSNNEANLRHGIEKALETHCLSLDIPWVPFTFEVALRSKKKKNIRFADVIHGAVVIEYEAPNSFSGKNGKKLKHAMGQAEEYVSLLHSEEGRKLSEYILIAWDGSHIAFGRFIDNEVNWSDLLQFCPRQAEKLLCFLQSDGTPLVHPKLLKSIVGPESEIGGILIPSFYNAILNSSKTKKGVISKTNLLFTEWKRLFSQVVGSETLKLKNMLEAHTQSHGQDYSNHIPEYLFALNTYIALVAKLVAGLSLRNANQDLNNNNVSIKKRIEALESGDLFTNAGVIDMLTADFFSWYLDNSSWKLYAPNIETLLSKLASIDYDINRKKPDATRDLFKGIYESFVPKAIRHSLGEYYTPDWLAEYILDKMEWKENANLLDPTCGTGTFIIEALKRRLQKYKKTKTAKDYLNGLYGIDLNPLAVITARSSIVVFLSPYLDPINPIKIPVFLADAINPAKLVHNNYEHSLQTEFGTKFFRVPKSLVIDLNFFNIFRRIRDLINADFDSNRIIETIRNEYSIDSVLDDRNGYKSILETVSNLVELHRNGWDGIWCYILADRFAASAIPKVKYIAGNPPWVKWSNLPSEYADFIKPQCLELGLFSNDSWVGGIESDISTVVTYKVVEKWLKKNGYLGFLITGTVFSTESSQGFRRFSLPKEDIPLNVIEVHDFKAIKPFENTANHPTLLLMQKNGLQTKYPLRYTYWTKPRGIRKFLNADDFCTNAVSRLVYASPVPGTDAGPWLRGRKEDHKFWKYLFGGNERHYKARKGITTDLNGVYFVKVLERLGNGKIKVCNDPSAGRKSDIQKITAIIEDKYVFPLLRGRGVRAFNAEIDKDYHVIIPQTGMHGDPELIVNAPGTYKFLQNFNSFLENRSSYKRFQKKQPIWSVWSTGEYTFSSYKVLWKEMSGKNFAAAYIGDSESFYCGTKATVPDHKLYFVPFDCEDEASFLTGFLNAPIVVNGVVAYAESLLSLGTSVVEYLNIPKYDPENHLHKEISATAKKAQMNYGDLKVHFKKLDKKIQTLLK